MHFFKSISTLLTGALLASTAVAAPAGHRMIKRDDVVERRIAACEASIAASGRLRRRDEIGQGEHKGGKDDKELVTHGMSDCIGLAVTLDRGKDDDGDDRWLIHFEAGGFDELDKLEEAVDKAKEKGATNIKVRVLHADPNTQVPESRESLEGDIKDVMEVANDIAGAPVTADTHPFTQNAGMIIKGDKTIEPLKENDWMNDKQKAVYDKQMKGEEVSDEEFAEAYPDAED